MTDDGYLMGGGEGQGPLCDTPVAEALHGSYVKTRRQEGRTVSWQQNSAGVLTLRRTFHSSKPGLSKLRPTPVYAWSVNLEWS